MVSRIKQASATSGSQSLSSQDSGNRTPRKKRQPDSGFDANKGYKRQPHERTEKPRGTRIAAPGTNYGREEHRKSCHQEKDNRDERYWPWRPRTREQEQQYNKKKKKRILSTSSKHNQKETEKQKHSRRLNRCVISQHIPCIKKVD